MIRLSSHSGRRALVAALLLSTSFAAPVLAKDAAAASASDNAGAAGSEGASASSDYLDTPASEITVVARHRKEKLQEVPLAISAIGGKELSTEHLERVADYTFKVPNFSALQQNTRVSGLFIRGLGGNASNDGAEGGVGLIVDNVVFTHVGFSWLDFVDLEGIEVVRGPQGTLLGKNTTIGAVIVKTAQPSFDPSVNVSATYGNNDLYQLRANATGPIIADKLAFRLTASTDQGGGWATNAYNGAKLLNNDRWSLRGQLLYTPSSDVTDRLIVEHYETHEYNNFYPAVADINTNLNTNGTTFTTLPNPTNASSQIPNPTGQRVDWQYKLANLFGYTNTNYNKAPYNANLDSQGRLSSKVDGVSNELNWDLGGPVLTSVTAYRRLSFTPHNDSDLTNLPIFGQGFNVDVKQYSQELRVASKKGGFLDWQLGAYYLQEDLVSNHLYQFGPDAAQFIGASLPVAATPAAAISYVQANVPAGALNGDVYSALGQANIDSIAGFAQGTLNITKRFTVTGGLRYTQERKSANVTGSNSGNGATGASLAVQNQILGAAFGGAGSGAGGSYAISGEQNNGSLSWLANPAYRLTDNVLLYGSAAYGVKSGAVNTAANAAQQNVLLIQPEKSLDFEAGVKTTWLNGKGILNLNFYNDTITNYQDSATNPLSLTSGNYLANVGKVRLRGVELEASLSPLKGVTVYFNTAYNDAKYLSYNDAPAPTEYQYSLAPLQFADYYTLQATPALTLAHQAQERNATQLSLTGHQIRNAPKVTVQAGLNLEEPIGHKLLVNGYVDASYRSSAALINPLSIYGWQSAYTLVNAGIGLKTEDKAWSLLVWSKNLTNKYYATAYAPATSLTPVSEVFGDPRSFGLTVSHKF